MSNTININTMQLSKRSYYPWLVVALLWVVALLNYMDRQMLSTMQNNIAADIPALQNAELFGALMAVFLWVYGIFSPFSGAVADRVSRKWLIVGSLGVWSGVTFAMGYCDDFSQLMWLRGIMGLSEALYIPSALSLIADYFNGRGRSLAIGLHMTGLYCGQALGGFGALVASAWSWQATFHWFGIIGVAYAVILVFIGIAHNAFLSVLAGLFFGVGYGMFDANNMPILCQFVSSRQRAMAYGFMNSVGVIMGAVTTQLLGGLQESVGLGTCFVMMGALLFVALGLQLLVLRPRTDDKDSELTAEAETADA